MMKKSERQCQITVIKNQNGKEEDPDKMKTVSETFYESFI